MRNKRITLFGTVVIILLILAAASGEKNMGQYIKSFAGEKGTNKELLSDNEIKKLIYFNQQVMNQSKSEATREAIDTLLKGKAIQIEAQKKGLLVEAEEVQKTIDFQIENANSSDSSELTKLVDGLDITVEEYYQEYAYERIYQKLVENKMFNEMTKDIQDQDEKVKLWNKEKQKIVKQFMAENHVEIEQLKKKYK